MTEAYFGVFIGVICIINIVFTFLHIFRRTSLWLLAMEHSVDSPRSGRRKTTNDWLKIKNIINAYYSKYDHYVAILSSFMMLINSGLTLFIFIEESSFVFDSEYYNKNDNKCRIYLYTLQILWLLSKLLQYSYISMLIYNAVRDSMFESFTSKQLKFLWFLLFILTIYLIFIHFSFDNSFININNQCLWIPHPIQWISIILCDIILTIYLLYLLVKPLYIASNEVHQRMTSLRDDPLHQLMWKYITLISPMSLSTFITTIISIVLRENISFSIFFLCDITFTNISTYFLFRKTPRLVTCCFKCLDLWIKCTDVFCVCCNCYSTALKDDIEFQKAAHEYNKSLSDNSLPPDLASHLKKLSSTYSTRSLTKLSSTKKLKRVQSKPHNNDNDANLNIVPPVQLTKQLSMTTHAKLRADVSYPNTSDYDDKLTPKTMTKSKSKSKSAADDDINEFVMLDQNNSSSNLLQLQHNDSQASLSAVKTQHIRDVSAALFTTLHDQTVSIPDVKLEMYLSNSIPSKYDRHQYLDHDQKSNTDIIKIPKNKVKNKSKEEEEEDDDDDGSYSFDENQMADILSQMDDDDNNNDIDIDKINRTITDEIIRNNSDGTVLFNDSADSGGSDNDNNDMP